MIPDRGIKCPGKVNLAGPPQADGKREKEGERKAVPPQTTAPAFGCYSVKTRATPMRTRANPAWSWRKTCISSSSDK